MPLQPAAGSLWFPRHETAAIRHLALYLAVFLFALASVALMQFLDDDPPSAPVSVSDSSS